MPKPPRLSLKSIVAATAGPALQEAKVLPFRSGPAKSAATGRGTLKERSKQLSVYLDPAVYDQLRDIAHTERAKIHPLMLEALDLLFANRGARSIRELEESTGKSAS